MQPNPNNNNSNKHIMRITSRSILSPGRAGVRDHHPPNSLSTSLSRRLRNSGSIKGGASPAMFTTSKKRGSFENQEPSSPKVTCIGQVRVKSKKKQAKKLRSLSRRHSLGDVKLGHSSVHGVGLKSQNVEKSLDLGSKGGQTMYRQSQRESQDNQESCSKSWVHFPVTICDALRAFGSEFSCLFPCRKEGKMVVAEDGHRQGSCGAFARWLVAVQDGGGGGGGERDIELVVGEEEEDDDEDERFVKKSRRHVFDDLEIVNNRIEGHKDEARVSICVPPKNALLLMRCRSDPVKVEALANRSWEPSFDKNDEEEEDDDGEEIVVFEDCKVIQEDLEVGKPQVLILDQDQDNVQQDEVNKGQELDNVQDNGVGQVQVLDNLQENEVGQVQVLENLQENEMGQVQEYENVQENELGQENVEENEVGQENVEENEVGQENVQENEMGQAQEHENVEKDEVGQDEEHEKIQEEEESLYLALLFEEILENQDNEIQEQNESTMVANVANIFEAHEDEMAKESTNGALEKESEKVLPECLLMMMYEPKLSMEVSRETWVCSKDFKQHSSRKKPPPAPVTAPAMADGGNANATLKDMMRVADGGFPAALQQPARSSCCLPAAPSMAAVLGQKLADAVGYEPFVLTRCKSEPMKTAAAKLLPESCVWENRKVERLSRVTFGSARLGF